MAKAKAKVKPSASIPSNLALESVIASEPRDDHAWSVLEDWILETDDPRAAIVLAERAAPPKQYSWDRDETVTAAYDKLRKRLLGNAPQWVLMKNRLAVSHWRAGHITTLYNIVRRDCDPALECELYAGVLASPAARLVRETALHEESVLYPFVELLAAAPAARSLRSLAIGFHDPHGVRRMELDGKLFAPFAIDELACSATTILRAGAPLARLRSLVLDCRDPAATVRLFGAMVFSELTTLSLETRAMTGDALASLLPGTATPKLEALHLHDPYNDVASVLIDALRASPLLRQLRRLKLGWQLGKVMPEPQAERVEPGAVLGKEFAHLELLTLPRDF